MNAPLKSTPVTDLIKAMALQMHHDPKLAYQAVTGVCEWPPVNGEAPEDLAVMAADKAYDLIAEHGDADQFTAPLPVFAIEKLRAAEMALMWLAEDARQARRDEEDWLGEHGRYRMPFYG